MSRNCHPDNSVGVGLQANLAFSAENDGPAGNARPRENTAEHFANLTKKRDYAKGRKHPVLGKNAA